VGLALSRTPAIPTDYHVLLVTRLLKPVRDPYSAFLSPVSLQLLT